MSKEKDEKFPNPKDVEKEIASFLSKRFGDRVKIISPIVLTQEAYFEKGHEKERRSRINFSLKPEELESYLNQYVIKQNDAKAVLATKICTHFNRIKWLQDSKDEGDKMVGTIKNNILMIGPTGVGKTYMIKLIAKKIGVPFVKGDATKFSETGYVGGDVEDLVRDLVREANDDIELAQYGIVYIDEIDKIAASRNIVGPDVSRTGVQRALLKPMEETEVDLKVPHDPVSVFQELERYRKTGRRERRVVNTRNILFIMSGAFNELTEIIKKRVKEKKIGFGASIGDQPRDMEYLKHVKAEDLIKFGFESEFIGRLPVITVFEELSEDDLFDILKNPNNPIVIGKKLDFKAYGIDIKFEQKALRLIARKAYSEMTGARGLVSAMEKVLLQFEKKLPSTNIKRFSVTEEVVLNPEEALNELLASPGHRKWEETFQRLCEEEREAIKEYCKENRDNLFQKHELELTPTRLDLIAELYLSDAMDINATIKKLKRLYHEVRQIEAYFYKRHDLRICFDDEAMDTIVLKSIGSPETLENFYEQLNTDFEHGLRLIYERTGQQEFTITKEALLNPEQFLNDLIRETYSKKVED
nr:AAA family ATPase [Desulfobacterales bacterium]